MIMMAFYHFPDVREKAIRAAQNFDWTTIDLHSFLDQMPQEIQNLENEIIDAIGHKAIERWAWSLLKEEKAKLLAEVRKRR